MKSFCLPPKDVERFKLALKSKAINMADLINMSTEKRTELLRQYAGDLAPEVNHLYEQKVVLKNRVQGMKNWASKVGEIGRYAPEKKAQIEKMINEYKDKQFERTFNPKENESFLNDLADAKLGTHVTREQAKQIYDLAAQADNLKKNYSEEKGWTNDADRLRYGMSQIGLDKYVEVLKNPELTLRELIQNRKREFKEDWKGTEDVSGSKTRAIGKLIKDSIVELDKNSIAVVASIDNSFLGRQGLKVLLTHPTVWAKVAGKSFTDIYQALKAKHGDAVAKDILHADLVSQPHYMNGTYQKAGLLAKFEEQYPTSHPARIPYIGRAFKASEVAFTNSALRMRMRTFDLLHDIAKNNGLEMTDVLVKDIGKVVNGLTSRANIGLRGQTTSLFLWAPRMMWANIQVLTGHGLGGGLKTAFAKRQAFLNLVKITASIGTVAAVLNALDPGSVETDPRSSDFLKYRKGDTRIDLTGGMGSYITLTARVLAGLAGIPAVKNSQTKIIKELNTGSIKDKTINEIGMDFLFNKTTPLVRTAGYIGSGRNFEGKRPTLKSTASDLFLPIPIKNFYQNFAGDYPEGDATAIIGSALDFVGINANTYQPISYWENKQTKEMEQLKKRVGEKRFNELNIKYNNEVNKRINAIVNTERYQKLSDKDKEKVITKIRAEVKRKYVPKVERVKKEKAWYE